MPATHGRHNRDARHCSLDEVFALPGAPTAGDNGRVRHRALLPVLAALVVIVGAASIVVGPAHLPLAAMVDALRGTGDPIVRDILVELRLPRTVLALATGAMLGAGGAALQGYLRNPLAEPGVLGVSATASLGAVIAIYWQLAEAHAWLLPAFAILGAIAALAPLLVLSVRSESPLTLILAGVALTTLAGAGISLALNLAPNPFAALEITTWLLGSLEDRTIGDLWIALPCIAVGLALMLWDGHALDALTLGEDGARALGANLRGVRLRLLAGLAIGIGGAVAVSGAIGFVGLIVPHLVRPYTDRSPSALLVPAALAGAVLLALADLMVRVIPTPAPLKLGVVTAFVGVPFFVRHLLRERRLW